VEGGGEQKGKGNRRTRSTVSDHNHFGGLAGDMVGEPFSFLTGLLKTHRLLSFTHVTHLLAFDLLAGCIVLESTVKSVFWPQEL
jgi:hypothetical protein